MLGLLASKTHAQTTQPAIRAVVKIAMTVDDMDRSIKFYTHVLGFQKRSDQEVLGADYEKLFNIFGVRCRIVELGLGNERLELIEFVTPRGRLIPRDSRSNDRWFQHIAIVTTDMDRAYAKLKDAHVRYASTAPQRLPEWNQNAAGIRAFYFRDPDDHVLEIISFPPGKGDPRWQQSTELFAGIDHTAIVVESTDASLAFYRDVLGLRVAGGSENYGDEQAHLNNVEGAHLRITTLKASSGPGVELLEYLHPRDGRAYPADAKANDLFHWQTTVLTNDATALLDRLRSIGSRIVSKNPTTPYLVRDPDGHALKVVETNRN
jgi:catechol 2,3-dioxygenase-like lactoylglutathione lyase family enzyme